MESRSTAQDRDLAAEREVFAADRQPLNVKNIRYNLCLPLTLVILLTQCDSEDPKSNANSRESESDAGAARSQDSQVAGNQTQGNPGSDSVAFRDGANDSPRTRQLPDKTPNAITASDVVPSDFEKQMGVLNQGMKEAIASGDKQTLIQNFKAAVKLTGDSPSSGSAVLGDLIPELEGKPDMARSLIDSMDGDQMMTPVSAHSIALTIENEEERNKWVQSLGDVVVREKVQEMLEGP